MTKRVSFGGYNYDGYRISATDFREALDNLAEGEAFSTIIGEERQRNRLKTITRDEIAYGLYGQLGGVIVPKGVASEFAGDVSGDPKIQKYVNDKARRLLRDRGFKKRVAKELRENAKIFTDKTIESLNERMRYKELADEIEQE